MLKETPQRPTLIVNPGELKCPTCGTTNVNHFTYWEDVGVKRYFADVPEALETERARVLLRIYSTIDDYDLDGTSNEHVLCANCLTELALPDDVEIDWL